MAQAELINRPASSSSNGRPSRPASPGSRESRLWFWATAAILFVFLAASAVPAPLYRVYQRQWHFSATTLTAVFAVYVFALLATLLFCGSLSDHLGRRPVVFAGLTLEVAACLVFVSARGVDALFLARGVQGVAVGLTAGTLSAALLDRRPEGDLAALISSAFSTGALAFGALAASILVRYGPAPTRLPWWLLLGAFLAGLGVAVAMPEPGVARPGALASLRPHISVPKPARAGFMIALPCVAGSWALGGFYLSLGPSLVAAQLHSANAVWGGVSIALLCGVGAAASVARRGVAPPRMMLEGCVALVVGAGLSVVAIALDSAVILLLATAVAGVGFGPVFLGAFRMIVPLAPADDRAGLVAAIFTVAYAGFGAPALAAGFATTAYGLRSTSLVYCSAVGALAAIAIGSLLRNPASSELTRDRARGPLPPAAPCTRAYCAPLHQPAPRG